MSEAQQADKTQSFDTRQAHKVLLEGLDHIQKSMEGAPLERKIEVGSVLWELGNQVRKVMDGIKEDVRQEAVKDLGGQVGNTQLDGDDVGAATVTILSASLKIPKGKDMEAVKQALGSQFSFFFEEVTTFKPRKEFEGRVEKVDDALKQKILLESVERHEHTPRVNFRRDRVVRRDPSSDTDLGALQSVLNDG